MITSFMLRFQIESRFKFLQKEVFLEEVQRQILENMIKLLNKQKTGYPPVCRKKSTIRWEEN